MATPEEKRKYCKRDNTDDHILILYAQEGCTECITRLWNDHIDLVRAYVIRKYKKTMYFDIDDLVNQSYFYFLDAIRKFDIDTGNKFSTFLTVNLQQLSRYVIQLDSTVTRPADYQQRLQKDESNKLSSLSIDTLRKENGTTFAETYEGEDLLPDVTLPIEKSEGRAYLDLLLSSLTPVQRQVVTARYLEGKSIAQSCTELGMTEFKLKKAAEAALKHLRLIAKSNRITEHLLTFEKD